MFCSSASSLEKQGRSSGPLCSNATRTAAVAHYAVTLQEHAAGAHYAVTLQEHAAVAHYAVTLQEQQLCGNMEDRVKTTIFVQTTGLII